MSSVGIYTASFLMSLLLMGLAQVFDDRQWRWDGTCPVPGRRRANLLFVLAALSIPVLLASVRKDVGTDYYNYQVLYRLINSFVSFREFAAQSGRTEPGFMLLNVAAFRLFHSGQMVFALSAVLIYGLFFAGIVSAHEQHSVMLGLFVFYTLFFFQSFNIVRQYIAMGIVFCSLKALCERRAGRYFLGIFAAGLFHNTALLVAPFYILYGKPVWCRWLKYACYAGLLLLLAVFVLAPSLLTGMGGAMAQVSGRSLRLGILLKRLPLLLLIGWYYPQMKARDERCKVWLSLYLISILIYHFGYFYVVFNRMALFFEVALIHLLPCAIRSIRSRGERIFVGLLLAAYLCLWCGQSMLLDNLGTCIPYQTIF